VKNVTGKTGFMSQLQSYYLVIYSLEQMGENSKMYFSLLPQASLTRCLHFPVVVYLLKLLSYCL
jgi:hypothetical protein